jgi:hypothetical protein
MFLPSHASAIRNASELGASHTSALGDEWTMAETPIAARASTPDSAAVSTSTIADWGKSPTPQRASADSDIQAKRTHDQGSNNNINNDHHHRVVVGGFAEDVQSANAQRENGASILESGASSMVLEVVGSMYTSTGNIIGGRALTVREFMCMIIP